MGKENKYDFEFEPSKKIEGQKPVTFASAPTVTNNSGGLNKKIVSSLTDAVADITDKAAIVGGGALTGAALRMKEIRELFSRLLASGMEPSDAANLASKQVLTASSSQPSATEMRPIAQPAGATSTQVMGQGNLTSGDKWAKAIGGPGGETVEQAVENYRMRKNLAPGETLLRSGIALPAGTNVRGAAPSSIPNIIQQEVAENAAREAVKSGSKAGIASDWAARTPGILGKLLGAAGGAGAAYQGYEALKGFREAQNAPETIQAILDMLSAAGSGATALPIPAAQLPGLALGLGIPAAGYVGRKISGALPDFGISEEARKAVR